MLTIIGLIIAVYACARLTTVALDRHPGNQGAALAATIVTWGVAAVGLLLLVALTGMLLMADAQLGTLTPRPGIY